MYLTTCFTLLASWLFGN